MKGKKKNTPQKVGKSSMSPLVYHQHLLFLVAMQVYWFEI
jgi:hypothetical protein